MADRVKLPKLDLRRLVMITREEYELLTAWASPRVVAASGKR